MQLRSMAAAALTAYLALAPEWALAQREGREPTTGRGGSDKIYRSLSTDQMEAMLKSFNVDYKKLESKTKGNYYYDYKKDNYTLRLYFFGGKDLMIDTVFNEQPLTKLNEWNTRAKFSRACQNKDDKGLFTTLEFNLDLLGGVTEGTIKQFMKTFDEEVRAFDKFLGGKGSPGPAPTVTDEKLITEVPAETIEKILDGLNHKYKKTPLPKNAGFAYDFTSKNNKIRLYNWGKDLMIDANFKKIPLDKINKYNLDRKFIRAVSYRSKDGDYSALESNLDCSGGVSESIIRYFITTFDGEISAYAKYVQNNE